MLFKKFLTEEQVGFAIGYSAALVVDTLVKGKAIKYGYQTLDWIASKTKILNPAPQILFERVVDAILDAY